MEKRRYKRALAAILAAVLMGNSPHLPENTMQVTAKEISAESSENTISGNNIVSNEADGETQPDKEQKSDTISEFMHIGQTDDLDALLYSDDSDYIYDMPVFLTESSKIRLFTVLDMTDIDVQNDTNTLTWSILRAETGTAPGTANLFEEEDDWTGFETVQSSPNFIISEDTDPDSNFYRTLTITAADLDSTCHYDYYIRAAFCFIKEQKAYTAVTTLPVMPEISETKESETDEAEGNSEMAETVESESNSEITETVESESFMTEECETAENPETEDFCEDTTQDELTQNTQESDEKESDTEETVTEDAITDESAAESETIPEDSLDVPPSDPDDSAEVIPPVTTISKLLLNKSNVALNPGDTLKPSVTIIPEGLNKNIIWSVNNPDIAAVDKDGTITALTEGTAIITAACDGKTANILISVVQTDADTNHDVPLDENGDLIAIADEVWVAGFEQESTALTYTGNKVTQNLRIYHKGTLLKEKTDYTLTYKNNVNAAAYNSSKAPSVTVTMKGQYTGGRTLYFTIAPREINEDQSLGYEQVIQYGKKIKIPAPTLYYGTKKLVVNKDFVCDYSSLPDHYTQGNSYEDGRSYEYTVTGTGNFTGSFTMKLAVVKEKKLDFSSAVVTFDKKQYEYHGTALSAADVQITSLTLNKKILDESFYEYEVYAEGTGTGYVKVYPSAAGRDNGYRGSKKLKIKVAADRNIKDTGLGDEWQSTITFSQKEINRNGGIFQKKTGVLIWNRDSNSEPLTEGIDYTVKYSNHKKAGTATVTFSGIGRYTGSFKKTYKIVPNTDLYIKWHNIDSDGIPAVSCMKGGAIPEFDLMELPQDEDSPVLNSKTDYSVKVKNNNEPGIMTCEITGKGNYKGYKSITEIKVISADISQGTISAADKPYSSKTNAWKSAVTIRDANGKKLKAGTDYDKTLTYSYAGMADGLPPKAGTIVYVTALGINNYADSSITGSYRIYSTSISKLTILIDAQEYTGKEIELSAKDIHVYANKNDVKKGIEITEPCYEIISYSKNIKAGTAKVTLRGTGDYGGTRICSFRITKKKYLTTRVTKVSLNETSLSLGVGNTRQLFATVAPEDAWNKTIIWTTSNNKIASVSPEGIITANRSGKVTITAASQDTGKKASCKISISVIPVTSFSLNTSELHQKEGTSYQLTAANIQPSNATYSTIQWESTNPETASVDADGKISFNKAGMAVIKAYADERRFVSKCLVFVDGKEETPPEDAYLTPQMFRTYDEDDDTKAFNDAIKNLNDDCNTLYVPSGTYKINARTSINLRSNMNVMMSPDAVLKAVGNSDNSYNIIQVSSVSNVTISGGQLIGERYEHGGNTGEWGMGIGIYDSTNINITDVSSSECWGDGIYIGSHHEEDYNAGCNHIAVTNCNLYNNRRNNLSIVCADYVTVDNCTFRNANGTAPEFGIDIETNNLNNPCEHIVISNSIFEDNQKGSIEIVTVANDISISNCILNGNFVNYAGTNVVISNSVINAKAYARIGVSLINGTRINDGSEKDDILVASFSADQGLDLFEEYKIDNANPMSCSVIEDNDSPSGKALCLKRQAEGTHDAGYSLNLSKLMEKAALEKGAAYRFEYVVKGSGEWGIKTNQTAWYPCTPMSDKFSVGITTYKADYAKSCTLMLYAVEGTKDMYLEIESIKIYKVN